MTNSANKLTHISKLKPIFVHGGQLTEESECKIYQLSERSPLRFMLSMASDWAFIILVGFLVYNIFPYYLYPLGFFLIASRQHALLILMHDAVHDRFLKSRTTAFRVCNWLITYPLFLKSENYKTAHLAHHLKLDTKDDPDLQRKIGDWRWNFPMSKMKIFFIYLFEVIGMGAVYLLSMLFLYRDKNPTTKTKKSSVKKFEMLIYYFLLFGLIHFLGFWKIYVLCWLIPAFTFLPIFLRFRSQAEHFGLKWGDSDYSHTRNYFSNPVIVWLFTPHHINYHLVHHLFPTIPFYRLPQAHKILLNDDFYKQHSHTNTSYFLGENSVINDLEKTKVHF